MNNLQQEKKKSITQRLIEMPYIIWAAGFIILPLLVHAVLRKLQFDYYSSF